VSWFCQPTTATWKVSQLSDCVCYAICCWKCLQAVLLGNPPTHTHTHTHTHVCLHPTCPYPPPPQHYHRTAACTSVAQHLPLPPTHDTTHFLSRKRPSRKASVSPSMADTHTSGSPGHSPHTAPAHMASSATGRNTTAAGAGREGQGGTSDRVSTSTAYVMGGGWGGTGHTHGVLCGHCCRSTYAHPGWLLGFWGW
jgi:hypothetical protein